MKFSILLPVAVLTAFAAAAPEPRITPPAVARDASYMEERDYLDDAGSFMKSVYTVATSGLGVAADAVQSVGAAGVNKTKEALGTSGASPSHHVSVSVVGATVVGAALGVGSLLI